MMTFVLLLKTKDYFWRWSWRLYICISFYLSGEHFALPARTGKYQGRWFRIKLLRATERSENLLANTPIIIQPFSLVSFTATFFNLILSHYLAERLTTMFLPFSRQCTLISRAVSTALRRWSWATRTAWPSTCGAWAASWPSFTRDTRFSLGRARSSRSPASWRSDSPHAFASNALVLFCYLYIV